MRDLIRKIPFQFRAKPKIEAILKAIEEELNELDEARSQLETLLYIETAEGINLDRIGRSLFFPARMQGCSPHRQEIWILM